MVFYGAPRGPDLLSFIECGDVALGWGGMLDRTRALGGVLKRFIALEKFFVLSLKGQESVLVVVGGLVAGLSEVQLWLGAVAGHNKSKKTLFVQNLRLCVAIFGLTRKILLSVLPYVEPNQVPAIEGALSLLGGLNKSLA